MKTPPKISVITISYNSKETIEDTITSVITQNYENKEYIVIDGGSNDGTKDIIQRYVDNIDLYISEKDKGISDAFNKGISHSTGDLIVFINSDDKLLPNALTKVAENYDEKTDIFCCNMILWDAKTGDQRILYPSTDFPVMPFFRRPAHQGAFIKSDLYQKIGTYDISISYGMDLDFLMRATRTGAVFKHINQSVAVFRLGGATNESIFKKRKEYLYIIRKNGGTWLQAHIFYVFLVFTQTTKKLLRLTGIDWIRKIRYPKNQTKKSDTKLDDNLISYIQQKQRLERYNNMIICILAPRFPMPECGGDLLRINYIARHLKAQGHKLILVSYTEGTPDLDAAKDIYDKIYTAEHNKMVAIFYSALFMLTGRPIQCGYYYSHSYNKLFKQVIKTEEPDMYVSHLLRMVPFLEDSKLQEKSIVEMTDALSKTYALATGAKGNILLRNVYKIEKHLIAKYEQYVIKRYPKVVLVSQSDIDFLRSSMGNQPTKSLKLHTNGVEYISKINHQIDTRKICFIGHMQSLQNQDAVIHFVNDIFPLLLAKKPDVKFYVVGAHPPKTIQKLDNGKNIFVTGFVDDLNKFVSDSCLAVAPVQIAAGIQNKVLVAMANAIPVVLTSLIAKAIPELHDGKNCFIRDDNQSFADICVELLDNQLLRDSIREHGRKTVIEHYSWEEKLKGYEV